MALKDHIVDALAIHPMSVSQLSDLFKAQEYTIIDELSTLVAWDMARPIKSGSDILYRLTEEGERDATRGKNGGRGSMTLRMDPPKKAAEKIDPESIKLRTPSDVREYKKAKIEAFEAEKKRAEEYLNWKDWTKLLENAEDGLLEVKKNNRGIGL